MSWRYVKINYGRLGSTETNPKEINILAGTTQCQVGGTIESTRAPMYSTLATLIDGNLTSATYWPAGTAPIVTVTMPIGHTDLTQIQCVDVAAHTRHTVYISQDKTEWIACPFISGTATQLFSIPALPASNQNFVANASLNITQFTHGAAQVYTQGETGGQIIGTPVNWTSGVNVTISNGTLTKTAGGDVWNAGAKGGTQYDGTQNIFFQVIADEPKNIAFGFTETGEPDNATNAITYRFQLNSNGTYQIWNFGAQDTQGNYANGDTLKVAIEGQQIKYYKNNSLIYTNTITIYWPVYIDGAIYTQGEIFTASINGGLEYAEPQAFEQTAQLNIAFSETAEKIYTANGYTFNQWSLSFLDFYFYTGQVYTANGYEYDATELEPITLTQTAAQDYTANGYSFEATDAQEIILDFGAIQDYTANGYNLEQNSQENIIVSYVGAQAYTAEGYERATMAQENILLVYGGAQVYTPRGYNFEATASQTILALSDTAAQDYTAHFEQNSETIINLGMAAAQIYTAHFENEGQLNFAMSDAAAQIYTANGYSNETTAGETIQLNTTASQIFTAHFENAASDSIPALLFATNTEYQANFETTASQNIFIEDLATATAVFSEGLQFQQNTQENINLSMAAAQTFTAFGGYEFNQSAVNNFGLTDAAASMYILGETGVYNQSATNYLYLQESTQTTYTRNWLDFESTAAESMGLSFGASSEHLQVNIFEANAAETITWQDNYKQFYGQYFGATAQDNISLSISAASDYTQNNLNFDMQATEFFFLHYTDVNVHTVNYLTFNQNMFYDFLFWDEAAQIYSQNSLDFISEIAENIGLSIATAMQYTNANWINGFATENIGLNMGAAAEYVQATIYNFNHFASDNVNLFFGAISEHVEAHIFERVTAESFGLNVQALSEYEHINVFNSNAIDPIDFEHWATFTVTTEPRSYEITEPLNFKLKIINWVYFESDIYQPTYKLEIAKPDSLWVATEQDAQDQYTFGRDPITKVDRRILTLTNLIGPTKTGYETEIKKPNTLYTKNNEIERGLMDD